MASPGFDPPRKQPTGDGASVTDRPTIKYLGRRTKEGAVVLREDDRGDAHELAMRRELRNHSPAGFEWDYGGSGPAQLALAILADAVGAEVAQGYFQRFKFAVVAKLDHQAWELTRDEVVAWVKAQDECNQVEE